MLVWLPSLPWCGISHLLPSVPTQLWWFKQCWHLDWCHWWIRWLLLPRWSNNWYHCAWPELLLVGSSLLWCLGWCSKKGHMQVIRGSCILYLPVYLYALHQSPFQLKDWRHRQPCCFYHYCCSNYHYRCSNYHYRCSNYHYCCPNYHYCCSNYHCQCCHYNPGPHSACHLWSEWIFSIWPNHWGRICLSTGISMAGLHM